MKIIFEREKCIGCGSCAALCPKYWEMSEDGKADLKNSKLNLKTGNQELEIKDIDCVKEAAETCPIQIIHVIEKS